MLLDNFQRAPQQALLDLLDERDSKLVLHPCCVVHCSISGGHAEKYLCYDCLLLGQLAVQRDSRPCLTVDSNQEGGGRGKVLQVFARTSPASV